MVLTNDAGIARRVRMLRNHGRDASPLHEMAGSNYRLSEMAAAIGLVQLGRLPTFNAQRRANARRLSEGLVAVATPGETVGSTHVFHQYTIKVAGEGRRAALQAHLKTHGIPSAVYYPLPVHQQPAYAYLGYQLGQFPVAERLCGQVLSLPMHPGLTAAQQAHIIASVSSFFAV